MMPEIQHNIDVVMALYKDVQKKAEQLNTRPFCLHHALNSHPDNLQLGAPT